jgi:hypothetical protein
MCGIFGIISQEEISKPLIKKLALKSMTRGRDSSGLIFYDSKKYSIERNSGPIDKLINNFKHKTFCFVGGHSRLVTNSMTENQPVHRDDMILLHNGIVINHENLWKQLSSERNGEIDSEIIIAVASNHLQNGGSLETVGKAIMKSCIGAMSCALLIPANGKLILFSNTGSLYTGIVDDQLIFASEKNTLVSADATKIENLKNTSRIYDIPRSKEIDTNEVITNRLNLVPKPSSVSKEQSSLLYPNYELKRCSKCILPNTMPYIKFDDNGVCNYCNNYTLRNVPKPKNALIDLVEPYKRKGNEPDCILPFSGGRDSCYGLHFAVKELGLKPITYTYDWGMVTDLGRRNISKMTADLGVENIIVAADIGKKRRNIKLNLEAWLKNPDLGMMSILTAGDKHFFRYTETVKKQTGIKLNLWGINPLEVTHFKAGFLGIKPDFEEEHVYSNGVLNQMRFHRLRFKAMTKSPGYYNRSLYDTLSGEYHRSFAKKSDYFHIFDFLRWDEKVIDQTLAEYDWELADDTPTTWRIGDGTAGFYNYVYYLFAGFTEHDTFRSNQIREGQLSRDMALALVQEENRPRYSNIKWYLDTLGMDYKSVIERVNQVGMNYIESLHNSKNTD